MTTPELAPCPFCGGEAEVERVGTARQSCIVACTDCGCRLESGERGYGAAWNARAPRVPDEFWEWLGENYSLYDWTAYSLEIVREDWLADLRAKETE